MMGSTSASALVTPMNLEIAGLPSRAGTAAQSRVMVVPSCGRRRQLHLSPRPNLIDPSLSADLTRDGALEARQAEIVRADSGDMIAIQLRLGYNILGYASVEVDLSGLDRPRSPTAWPMSDFRGVCTPRSFIPHDDRDWDVSLFAGGGYSIAGYKPVYDPRCTAVILIFPSRTETLSSTVRAGRAPASALARVSIISSRPGSVGVEVKAIRRFGDMDRKLRGALRSAAGRDPDAWVVAPTLRLT